MSHILETNFCVVYFTLTSIKTYYFLKKIFISLHLLQIIFKGKGFIGRVKLYCP